MERDRYSAETRFPSDLLLSSSGAHDVLAEADLFIVSAYMPDSGGNFRLSRWPDTPVARHYSTEPFRWVEKEPSADNSTIVGQYQWRFAKHLAALPNCIPIDDEMFSPARKPEDRTVIVYTPTSKRSGGWGTKGYLKTAEALRLLSVKYKDEIEVAILFRRPYVESMRAKRHAHIVIDECATGSYHGSGLEGLACGAATFAFIDRDTDDAIKAMYDGDEGASNSMPWQCSTLNDLHENLESLIMSRNVTIGLGRMARKWMEENYSERWQATKWIDWHRSFLQRSGKK